MNNRIIRISLVSAVLSFAGLSAVAEDFNSIPSAWKWVSDKEVVFTYDGTYTDSLCFSVRVPGMKTREGVSAPELYRDFPVKPEGAVNLSYSPDSTMLAFTRDNDLYVVEIATGRERRLTSDGTDLILNGYASWVYYEEILGRPSKYKAFWWSPDSRTIAFYRFDNSDVPLFPIYSPFGQNGSLANTRYPKAGERNPEVKIGFINVDARTDDVVWADFDESLDQYFGIPFWGKDGSHFYVARMPRLQNSLELFRVSAATGEKELVYDEKYDTWIDWISEAIFTENGLYMARSFETGWEQIYYLSYDGKTFSRLTDGPNWNIALLRVDEKNGDVYFTAKRDSRLRNTLYKVDEDGVIESLTDTLYDVSSVKFSPSGKHFAAMFSNSERPTRISVFRTSERNSTGYVVADMAGADFNPSDYALPETVWLTTSDGFRIPALLVLPKNFGKTGFPEKYPVHMDIYGGPDTPLVRDRWVSPSEKNQWWSDNGIIQITADCRAAGHCGRKGLDMVYRQLGVREAKDFVEWAEYLKTLPYVDPDKIGVEGFSFGGTMTAMLLCTAPESFHYGIAGGGVYDWALYDSHYTERYMDTPENNPDGYRVSRLLEYVEGYPVDATDSSCVTEPVYLRLTHGTGDDNVHFQNTLQLVDALQKAGKRFELMIYPDGMHGYKGYQGEHFLNDNRKFWRKYLLGE